MSRQVIARINPINLGAAIVGAAALLLVMVSTLHANGWTNPAAFASPGGRWFPTEIPLVGHAVTLVLAGLVGVLMVQYAALAMQKFGDVVIEDSQLFYASRPWLGKIPLTCVLGARITKSNARNRITRGSNNIEIRHRVLRHGRRGVRTTTLISWFYREELDQIVANLQACGIEVSALPLRTDLPIWEREPPE